MESVENLSILKPQVSPSHHLHSQLIASVELGLAGGGQSRPVQKKIE